MNVAAGQAVRPIAARRVQVRLLGPLELTVEGRPVELGAPKQRALFALLALARGEVVAVDRIMDGLWGDRAPRTAEHSIQLYVSNLRRALAAAGAEGLILTQRPGYRMALTRDALDVTRFEDLAAAGAEALAKARPGASELLEGALNLWSGEPLLGVELAGPPPPEVAALETLRARAREDLAGALLAANDSTRAVTVAQEACATEPFGERPRELLMLALYRSGRQAEALRTYSAYRKALREELGLDPSPVLAGLQERILVHDSSLLPRPGPTVLPGPPRNPYKGLRPFQEDDAEDFFGRDDLMRTITAGLESGNALVTLVGPSGSGKSSVLAAGVLPRARQSHRIVEIPADLHDSDAIAECVRGGLTGTTPGPRPVGDAPVLVVLDQFEQHLLALGETGEGEFFSCLARMATWESVTLLVALRADLYDRPLRHPDFAAPFVAGVVNVLPMTAAEIEAAVVRPAARVGVEVEPALLGALVADTADKPAQLPLLQYALTELFERGGHSLGLAGYRALGGLDGALTRRADAIRAGWDDESLAVATQLFLRLLAVEGGHVVRRRATVRELGSLRDTDPGTVAAVLSELVAHHLVTLDRDTSTSTATAEVAHESLFAQWPWLSALVEEHRTALERHASLRRALSEWESAGQDADFLLRGTRLRRFQDWRRDGVLRLTDREVTFLDASQRLVEESTAQEQAEAAERTRLERRARRRGLAAAAAVLVGSVAATAALLVGAPDVPRVAWVYHRDGFVERFLETGLDRAVDDGRFTLAKADVTEDKATAAVERLADRGQDLIVVSTNETDLARVARRHPDTRFLAIGDFVPLVDAPNVTFAGFADHEGAFLAGAAAALVSDAGVVGFLGGADTPTLLRFQAGFEAGVQAVNPDTRVLVRYSTRLPVYDGFVLAAPARQATRDMVAEGADVVFAAAGGAQFAALTEIVELSDELDRHLWGIGADSDAFTYLDWQTTPQARRHVLTSMVKHFDRAVYDAMSAFLRDRLTAGTRVYNLSNDGLGLTTSGGHLEPFRERLDTLRRRVESGELVVPCVPAALPAERVAEVAGGVGCPG